MQNCHKNYPNWRVMVNYYISRVMENGWSPFIYHTSIVKTQKAIFLWRSNIIKRTMWKYHSKLYSWGGGFYLDIQSLKLVSNAIRFSTVFSIAPNDFTCPTHLPCILFQMAFYDSTCFMWLLWPSYLTSIRPAPNNMRLSISSAPY